MSWLLPLAPQIVQYTSRAVLWVPRRLRLVKQEKKEAEDRLLVILEKEKSLLETQLKAATDLAELEALKENLEVAKAAQRACYAKIRDRLLERAGLPPYDALVANGKRVLEPQNRAKLTEAVRRLELLPPAPSAEQFMASATAKYALERHDEALADLNKAVELRPDYPEALNNRGYTYDELKRYDEALADYNKALELRPDYPEILNNRGVTYRHLKRYEEALADHNKALDLRADYPEALNNRGSTYDELKRYDEALADYNKALELRPDYPEILNNRGITYHELERYEEALADYNKALELMPDFPEALTGRGATHAKMQRYDEALADLNRALELRPDLPSPLYNMACLFSLKRERKDAISHLEKAIAMDEKYRRMAAEDSDFDSIRDDPRFRRLMEGD